MMRKIGEFRFGDRILSTGNDLFHRSEIRRPYIGQGVIVWPFGTRGASYKRFNVQPGDLFIKSDGRFHSTWVVHQIVDLPDVPPHARLIRHGDPVRGYRTISILALMDPTYYRRAPQAH